MCGGEKRFFETEIYMKVSNLFSYFYQGCGVGVGVGVAIFRLESE